jgi:hypothetical protein
VTSREMAPSIARGSGVAPVQAKQVVQTGHCRLRPLGFLGPYGQSAFPGEAFARRVNSLTPTGPWFRTLPRACLLY